MRGASVSIRPFSLLLTLLLGMLRVLTPAAAQSAAEARLSDLDTSGFPSVQAYLDVHLDNGDFLHGLHAEDVTMLENNQRLPVDALQQILTDVQFVTALTLGPAMGVRDGLGVSRYEYLVQGLKNWQWDPEAADDLSLLISDGPELVHRSSYAEWLQTWEGFQPDARSAMPNLQLLSRALEVAGDPSPRAGMERMVLFITPPLGIQASAGLQNLAGRAQQSGIRIFVWLVAAPEFNDSIEADMLRSLAATTRGQFFFFSGSEPVPDLETYLKPLRPIYQLSFTSAIRSSGAFPLSAEINADALSLSTPEQMVQYQVQAPNPVFVGAPAEIARTLSGSDPSNQSLQATALPLSQRLIPTEQELEILVEFADGNPRPLQRSALYANGELVMENSQEPFDHFTWDLRDITETQRYLLRAEVTDSLGLTGSTIELPVEITVELPNQGFKLFTSNQGLVLAGLMVLLAGSILAVVLLVGGRIRPRVFGRGADTRAAAQASRNLSPTRPTASLKARWPTTQPLSSLKPTQPAKRRGDPVTQPVDIAQAPPRSTRQNAGRRWSLPVQLRLPSMAVIPRLRLRSGQPQARRAEMLLEPLPLNEEADNQAPLPLAADEIKLGRSPTEATWVIDEPSLEAVHATLQRAGETYRVSDAGSIAGTWVNYKSVPAEGILLQHGDLVHLGRVGFRFVQRVPGSTRKPAIIVYNSE